MKARRFRQTVYAVLLLALFIALPLSLEVPAVQAQSFPTQPAEDEGSIPFDFIKAIANQQSVVVSLALIVAYMMWRESKADKQRLFDYMAGELNRSRQFEAAAARTTLQQAAPADFVRESLRPLVPPKQ